MGRSEVKLVGLREIIKLFSENEEENTPEFKKTVDKLEKIQKQVHAESEKENEKEGFDDGIKVELKKRKSKHEKNIENKLNDKGDIELTK